MRKFYIAIRWSAGLSLGLAQFGASAHPADSQPPVRDFQTYQPSVNATRINDGEAPNIDGDLSDPIWAKAQVLDEFYQLEPKEGSPASERTVVRVLFDANNLYFAVYAYDREPAKINATIKARDGALSKDDLVRIYLDPYMSRRDGYAFEINALGARLDALVQNNNQYLPEWNTTWSAKSRIVSDGWMTEVAIPFRSISYDVSRANWGFDFFRLIRRKGERIRWSQIHNQMPSVDISRSGTMFGITDTEQGMGLDVQLYGSMRYKHEWNAPSEDDVTFQPSGNAYYKITSALTGTLTFNTDFSDTPLDDRRVNTGRFALFFPETRDFFLQDASVFEFGGDNLADNVNGRPFFSRNIGLVNGVPVDIVAGGKLSGQIGEFGVGGLIVDTQGTDLTDGQILAAGRITHPIGDESKIGLVFTNGDPTGQTENAVAGADFQFRNSTWFNGDTLKADFFYERSFSNAFGDDDTFGASIAYPNEPYSARFSYKQIGENFYPALGFVNRSGIRVYDGNFVVHQSVADSETFRWWEAGSWYNYVTGLDDQLQSRENGVWFGLMTPQTDVAFLNLYNDFESVPSAFFLPHNVLVPAGDYTWSNASIHAESSVARPISFVGEIECCNYFNGDLLRTYLGVNWRPNSTFDIGLAHQFFNITMPTGDVEIQIYAANLQINFTPDMQIRTQMQYDNISEDFGLSARYRWEFAPGSELFVALGESGQLLHGSQYRSDTSQASVRIGHLERF
ncbi:MAG: carbohydrate binding family 9 domain-containing protein [Micropepsaceae bacterium]